MGENTGDVRSLGGVTDVLRLALRTTGLEDHVGWGKKYDLSLKSRGKTRLTFLWFSCAALMGVRGSLFEESETSPSTLMGEDTAWEGLGSDPWEFSSSGEPGK